MFFRIRAVLRVYDAASGAGSLTLSRRPLSISGAPLSAGGGEISKVRAKQIRMHAMGTGSMVRSFKHTFMLPDTAVSTKEHVRLTFSGIRTEGAHGDCWSETVRTGTKLRYALYEDLGSEVRAFRLCANASEP